MKGIELQELAWKEFDEWCERYEKTHPDHDLDVYELALLYGKEPD